jgi:hypothetical protein
VAKRAPRSNTGVAAQVYSGMKSSSAGFNHMKYTSQPQMENQLPPATKKPAKTGNRGYLRDKEQLQEEAIKLKITANSVRDENTKLKTKIKMMENELSKKEKQMEEIFHHHNHMGSPGPILPSNLG